MPELLLIDDDPGIAAALRIRLKAAGMDVRCATGGAEALEMVKERTPDIALLDVRMPGMDGIEVCRRLKADPVSASFPVVFLSAETSEATREAALQAGGVRFISKPYDAGKLVHCIHETLCL